MTQIWTPKGEYEVGSRELEVLDHHAKVYDYLLSVGRNHQTGDICLFREQPDGTMKPLFGWQRYPSVEELQEKLYNTDVARHGIKLYDDLTKRAQKVKQEGREEYNEVLDDVSERIAFELRKG